MRLVLVGSWEEACQQVHRRALEMTKIGVKPTLRTLFYWAADAKRIIVHSQAAYKQLSAAYARFREKVGEIGVLEDKSRRFLTFDSREPIDLNGYLERALRTEVWYLKGSAWRVPRWWGQKRKVELWIEKEAITVLEEVARELSVDAFPSRGFSSITMLHEAAGRLKEAVASGLEAHVLALTDFDPSGVFIERDYRKKLRKYGAEAQIERIAVTPEQVREYGLPAIPPDDPSYRRIVRDPRYPAWKSLCEEMGIPPEPVELDAFVGLYPEEFREVVIGAVNKHFDPEVDARRRQLESERKEEAEELAKRLESMLNK